MSEPVDEPLEGQMDIDECIEVAETGADGKKPGRKDQDRPPLTERPQRKPLSVAEVVAHKLGGMNVHTTPAPQDH